MIVFKYVYVLQYNNKFIEAIYDGVHVCMYMCFSSYHKFIEARRYNNYYDGVYAYIRASVIPQVYRGDM